MFCLLTGAKCSFFQAPAHELNWRFKKISCRTCLLFYYFFGDKKKLLRPVASSAYYRILLICIATVQNQGENLGCYVLDVSRSAQGRVFLFSCERLGRSLWKIIASSFELLNLIFIEVTWKLGYLSLLNFVQEN